MTLDEFTESIIQGILYFRHPDPRTALSDVYLRVVAEERERCAMIAEDVARRWERPGELMIVAARIRGDG